VNAVKSSPLRHRWFFFSTPLPQFLAVMGPLAIMMVLLASLPSMPTGIRVSSAVVAIISIYSFFRGYHSRIEATSEHIRFRSWRKNIVIPWREVRMVARYTPLDRNRTCQYVFVTRLDTPPVDRREIDENTIQLQDRPDLLETLRMYHVSLQEQNALGKAGSAC
jgi:hypothetical protein